MKIVSQDELKCPGCNGINLHHFRVEVYDRNEDENFGTLAIVDSTPPECIKDLKLEASFNNNPSPRRHGLRIFFYCEICSKISVLAIIQHKGSTYIEWQHKA